MVVGRNRTGTQVVKLQEFSQPLLRGAGLQKRKGHDNFLSKKPKRASEEEDDQEEKLVCVTSGLSYLGLAIVNRLLACGYLVRVIVHNQEEVQKLKEMEMRGEMAGVNGRMDVALANLTEFQSLLDVFDGCVGVFHTSAFVDPVGLSGYSKAMAEIEVKATENVEACVRTNTIRKCVLTSSLLACIWQDRSTCRSSISPVINHDCWSDESLCIQKKLWYALGKLKSERLAWRIATENGLKLTAICPGLITGPEFSYRNPTATTAYLKGAQEMYGNGLLATVDVIKLAEAHVCIYKAMNGAASGRYVCFNQVIKTSDDATRLAEESGIPERSILQDNNQSIEPDFELSNRKLAGLLSRSRRHCYEDC